MSDDAFSKVSQVTIREGLRLVPGVSLVEGVFRSFIRDNDQAFNVALTQDLLESVLKCQQRIELLAEELDKQGAAIEELGGVHRTRLLEDLVDGLRDARSEAKRDAIISAVAHQFDPTLGSQGTRKFLLDVIGRLDDLEIEALRMFVSGKCVVTLANEQLLFNGPWEECSRDGAISSPLSKHEVTVLQQALISLADGSQRLILRKALSRPIGDKFELTHLGEAVVAILDHSTPSNAPRSAERSESTTPA